MTKLAISTVSFCTMKGVKEEPEAGGAVVAVVVVMAVMSVALCKSSMYQDE